MPFTLPPPKPPTLANCATGESFDDCGEKCDDESSNFVLVISDK